MSDPTPPLTRAEVLAKHAIKPGETRNPKGSSSWQRAQGILYRYMTAPIEKDKDVSRLENVVRSLYLKAIKGDVGAGKVLIEQCAGRPKQQVDITSNDHAIEGSSAAVAAIESVLAAALAAKQGDPPDGKSG